MSVEVALCFFCFFYREAELLKSRWNVCIHAASSRVWLCLAASCSQDAFLFFIINLAKTSGHWHECSSDRFWENPTCNMKYLNVDVQLKWRNGIEKNFVLLMFILVKHLSISKARAVGVSPHDAAVHRCSNVGCMEPKKYLAIKNSNYTAILAWSRKILHKPGTQCRFLLQS